ncbi:MAG: hypothetical protein J7L14_02220 [Candidatus Diapherotrites archaeon]|nr:hypothetical protein [Candidatus Diapherotrites archaeon]
MRKISFHLYFSALIIAMVIFVAGLYLGFTISETARSALAEEMQDIEFTFYSSELLFLLEPSVEFCPVYGEQLGLLDRKTAQIGAKLEYLENVKKEFDFDLKRKYFVLEAETYLLAEKFREICDYNYSLILYFYTRDCEGCIEQGHILDEVKRKFGESVRIYSFDLSIGSSVAEALARKYAVRKTPAVIVDGKLLEGLSSREEIEKNLIFHNFP